MNVTLYTTHCPQCTVLEKKLQQANINYEINEDPEAIRALGYLAAPILVVDGNDMLFKDACIWIDSRKKDN